MGVEPLGFICAVVLPNGTSADVQQTDIQRSTRENRTFFVVVRPHGGETTCMGVLNLSSTSLRSLVLTAVALAACYVPARHAMKVEPIVALRQG